MLPFMMDLQNDNNNFFHIIPDTATVTSKLVKLAGDCRQCSGFQQLSAAVDKTNKRVSATRGTNPYFEVVDTDYDIVSFKYVVCIL